MPDALMRLRNTILTGAASYVQMGSLVLTQLVAIPIALTFLDNERFGLWSFISQSLGYVLLLDFGVTNSLGRLLTDPIHKGDERTWNGWFNLFLAVLLIQAGLILGAGVLLTDPILQWFNIPAPLLVEARRLWLMLLFLNALMFPLRLFPGILGAQNRSYWVSVGAVTGSWFGLLTFYLFLRLGWSTLAYGFSAAVQMLVSSGLTLLAVSRGPNRFRVSFRDIPWHHTRELFGFSLAVFVIGIAVQVALVSQAPVITKIVGLGAVASFTMCSRVPMLLMQCIWRPFDAFLPRWQILWAKQETAPLTEEFRRLFRLTMGLAALAMTCCFALNRWFVFSFGKQELYAGKTFDLFFALFVVLQVWSHCLACAFVLAKRMKGLAAVASADTVLGLIAGIAGAQWHGLNGYIAFTVLYNLVSLGFWYCTLKAPKLLNLSLGRLVRDHGMVLFIFSALLAGEFFAFRQTATSERLLLAEGAAAVWATACFTGLFRGDLLAIFRRFRRARQDWLAARPEAPPRKV
jgi:O-antigen/teichoic acid export membrane protein